MQKVIKAGERHRYDLKSTNISKLRFVAIAKAASGLSTSASNIDWSKINITGILRQASREIQLFNGDMLTLLKESAIFSNNWGSIETPIVLENGVHHVQYGVIDFGGILNLDNDDELTLDINVADDIWHASATGNCTIEFSDVEDIGLQYVLPRIRAVAVTAGETEIAKKLGDNVTSICLINHDKTGVVSSDAIFTGVKLSSDRYNTYKNYAQVLSDRVAKYPSLTSANARAQSFSLSASELDKCEIQIDLVSAEITAGNNFLVYRDFIAPVAVVQKAQLKAQKHKKHAENKVVV